MKISYLLILSITILFLIYAIHNYFTYEFTINEAKKITLLRGEAQANNIVQDLDKYISTKITDFQSLTKIKQIQTIATESNRYFMGFDSAEQTTTTKNINYDQAPFLSDSAKKEIAKELQGLVLPLNRLDTIKELSITNQYGISTNIFTGKSTRFQQDPSWLQTTKNMQNYVGHIEYDKNHNDHVILFAAPILDDSSNYVGTLAITLSHRILFYDFLNDVDVLQEAKKTVVLLDEDGNTIYQEGEFFPKKPVKEYFSKLTEDNGSFEFGFPNTDLVSYASSIGYKDFTGFGWIVIIEQQSSVIEEFVVLERNFLISTVIGLVSATALGIVLSRFVTNPLGRLSRLTEILGKGDFDAKIQTSKIAEINAIMKSFKEMEISLKKLFETEKKLVEANTRIKNERLAAVGELASSMAHDMKNPLGTIRTGMDILKRNAEIKPEMGSVIQRMDRAVSRMSHQVEDVLNYVRKTPLTIKPVPIKSIIRSSIQALEIPKTIQITVDDSDITIDCDERKMEIVFINLILNSIQAIDQKEGKVIIRIKQIDKDAVIEIEDSGPGVPENVAADIFKPLITTKQKGTGLGLASCKNIIEQHGGSIIFQNNPTVFRIVVPIMQTQ
ncbi:MAG: sensor histidine kinase [Candidatus Nitrosotenuis sp.]